MEESPPEDSNEKQLQNSHQSLDDESNSENSSVDDTKIEIPDDDLIVQILARLDGPSYSKALYQDAGSINDSFLVPPHFPWHSETRLPRKVAKTMPRDIDDLHVITHCKEKLEAPFGDFEGPFGKGKYENGQSRGNYSNTPSIKTHLLKPGTDATAAARRSQDPGVIELNVRGPLPSSIEVIMNTKDPRAPTPAENWKVELSKVPDHEEMLSRLPFHWGKRAVCPRPDEKRKDEGYEKQGAHAKLINIDAESQKVAQTRLRSKAQVDLAASCSKKWSISVKVDGVSSRHSLFPSSSVIDIDNDQAPENTRKVIRPMLCYASLPSSTQIVGLEQALEMDKAGLAQRLGSYDCRFTDALLNPKRDSANRAKRIEVGRVRIIWSNLIQGDQPFLPSARSRVNYNSLITGQRLDASKCIRPPKVKVGLRVDGRIVTEEAVEDLPTTVSSARKRKHSTRQAENESLALNSCVQCPESRTDEEIDAAFNSSNMVRQEDRVLEHSTENGAVVYLEMGVPSNGIDKNEIIAHLMKFNQKKSTQKKLKRSSSSASMQTLSTESVPITFGGSQAIKRSCSPRFVSVPLEDGLLRTVCINAGTMAGTAVHQVMCEVSEQEPGKMCSVCWSDEGSAKEGVQECVTCGLLAHPNCCLDKGDFSSRDSLKDSERQPLGPHLTKQDQLDKMNDAATPLELTDRPEEWQCAVCCRYTEKEPRRNAKMPFRFSNGETNTHSDRDIDVANRNSNVPGPPCSLCPHRGGAMSLMDPNHGRGQSKWAHEVCRIWSGFSEDSKVKSLPLPLTDVCACCGTGGMKGNKSMDFRSGLTRCAARGCLVAFHPMCALLATKVGIDDKSTLKLGRTRKTRHTEQELDVDESIDADKKLCKEYTLQLVQLARIERGVKSNSQEEKTSIIPVAFCGIHNPQRDDKYFGYPPGGAVA